MINFIKAIYHWSRIRKDEPVDRPKRKEDAIDAVRRTLSYCWFDHIKCEH